MSAFRAVADEVPNEAEVTDLADAGRVDFLLEVEVGSGTSFSPGAITKHDPATEACVVLLELFLQLFAGAALQVFRLLGVLAFPVSGGLLLRNSLVGKRLLRKSFGGHDLNLDRTEKIA